MIEPIEATVDGWSQDMPDTPYNRQRIAEGIMQDIVAQHYTDMREAIRRAALLGMAYHDLKAKYL